MRSFVSGFLDFFFPVGCVICGQIVDTGHNAVPICKEHEADCLRSIEPPYCNQCGIPLDPFKNEENKQQEEQNAPMCGACRTERPQLDFLFPGFEYRTSLNPVIVSWKYEKNDVWGRWFKKYLARRVRDNISPEPWDGIIPVPLHPSKYRERGFNQARQLGQGISEALRIPIESPVEKHRKTKPQSSLKRSERLENLQNAFSLKGNPGNLTENSYILVDDIYTTGSTLKTLAGLLRDHGVQRICGIVLYRTIQDDFHKRL